MNNSVICVDASLVVKLFVPEEHSERVASRWEGWTRNGILKVAPRLLRYEVAAVLRKKVWRGLLAEADGRAALDQFLRLRIELLDPEDLQRHAWQFATRFNQPSAYDCHYLALAELLDCHFWTGDLRFFNSVPAAKDRIAWAGSD